MNSSETESARLLRVVLDAMQEGVIVTGADGRIRQVNEAVSTTTGWPREDLIGAKPSLLRSGLHDDAFYKRMYADLEGEGCWSGEIWNRKRTGELYPEVLTITVLPSDSGPAGHVAVFADRSEVHALQAATRAATRKDPLTDLLNRWGFLSSLKQVAADGGRGLLLLLDLDGFDSLNQDLGRARADQLICELSGRLRALVSDSDLLARVGADQFAHFVSAPQRPPTELAQRLLSALAPPFSLDGLETQVRGRAGIVHSDMTSDAHELLGQAEVAVRDAKKEPSLVATFGTKRSTLLSKERSLARGMDAALLAGEFKPWFQPRWAADDGRLLAAEALVRWERPNESVLAPGAFLGLMRRRGLMQPLGLHVMREVAAFIHAHRSAPGGPPTVSINIEPEQLRADRIVRPIRNLLDEYSLPPASLELELTEQSLVLLHSEQVDVLRDLREMGIRLAVDDFGTGYSSLQYLSRLPLDTLKIDRAFVWGAEGRERDRLILEAIVTMAGALGLDTVAEGVETEAQARVCRELGVSELQGYLLGRPMPGADYSRKLAEQDPLSTAGDRSG